MFINEFSKKFLNYGDINEYKALEIDEIVKNQWKGRITNEVKNTVI